MKPGPLVVAIAAVLALSCAKKEKTASPPPAPAEQPRMTQTPSPPPAPQVDDSDLAAECRKAQTVLDAWGGDSGQLEDVRKLLLGVLSRNRDYAPAYVALSRLERRAAMQSAETFDTQGLQRSQKFAEHALKLDPNNAEAYAAAAWTAIDFKDFDRAATAIDQAEQLGERPLEVKILRAELAYRQSDPKAALNLAKEIAGSADATLKERILSFELMQLIYGGAGAVDEADRAYQEELKADPDRAWAHGNYADFLLLHGRVDDAIAQAERAVRLMPYPNGILILGNAYVAKANQLWDARQYDAAATYIEKVATIAGGNADLYYYLGLFYERASKRTGDATLVARAAGAYRRALELNPRHGAARKAIDRLSP